MFNYWRGLPTQAALRVSLRIRTGFWPVPSSTYCASTQRGGHSQCSTQRGGHSQCSTQRGGHSQCSTQRGGHSQCSTQRGGHSQCSTQRGGHSQCSTQRGGHSELSVPISGVGILSVFGGVGILSESVGWAFWYSQWGGVSSLRLTGDKTTARY